jgi:tetratricopeptide (TPR) repeat protein
MMDEIGGVYDGEAEGGGRWEVGVALGAACHSVGLSYFGEKKWEKSISLLERALRMRLDTLGEQHPATAVTLQSMGAVYGCMGSHDTAIMLCERALRIFKDTLGLHPLTAFAIQNMGTAYSRKGQHKKAIELYEQALRIYERTVGRMHCNTAGAIFDMSTAYYNLGELVKVEELGREVVEIYKKTLGPDHEWTKQARKRLSKIPWPVLGFSFICRVLSLLDIILSETPAVLMLFSCSTILLFTNIINQILRSSSQNENVAFRIKMINEIVPPALISLACLVSPRSGRYTFALAIFFLSFVGVVEFAISAHSALYDNCVNCANLIPPDLYPTLTGVQAVLSQPTSWIIFIPALYCMLFKQKFFFPVVFAGNFINSIVINSIIGWSVVFKLYNPILAPVSWLCLFVIMYIFRCMGNKRDQLIYQLNSAEIEQAFTAFHEK